MKNFQSEEALVASYWRKLARSIDGTQPNSGALPASRRTSKINGRAFADQPSNVHIRRRVARKLVGKADSLTTTHDYE
jgi:hypothetical protein